MSIIRQMNTNNEDMNNKLIEELDQLLLVKSVITHKLVIIKLLDFIIYELLNRGLVHDDSKLKEPESKIFSSNIRIFNEIVNYHYIRDSEIENELELSIEDGKQLHYNSNSHHPEHYGELGINGMDLIDLVEMVCDWLGSHERYKNIEEVEKMLSIQYKRFGIDEQLGKIISNSVKKWIKVL